LKQQILLQPAVLTLTPNRSIPATGVIGDLIWQDNDSVPSTQEFARIRVSSTDVTTTTEDATMTIRLVTGGTSTNYILFNDAAGPSDVLFLQDLRMFAKAIVFDGNATNPGNSEYWTGRFSGTVWSHAPTGSQHDFAINGSSEFTIKAGEYDFKDNELKLARNLQFSGSGTLPSSFLAYIQYNNTPGVMLLNVQSGKEVSITVDATEEYAFGATIADWNGNKLTNLGETRLLLDNTAAQLALEANHTTPAGGQTMAFIDFDDDNSVNVRHTYAQIAALIEDPTNGSEDGELFIKIIEAGILTNYLGFNEDNDNSVTSFKKFNMHQTNATPIVEFFANHTTPAAGQVMAEFNFRDDNSLGTNIRYARIQATIEDPANPVEEAGLNITLETNGSFDKWIELNTLGDNEIQFNKLLNMGANNISSVGTLNTHTIPGGTDTIALIAAAQALTNKTFNNTNEFEDDGLIIQNPANTFNYIFQSSAITVANRTITLPLLTGNDIMTLNDFAATLTNKTLGTATVFSVDFTLNDGVDIIVNATTGSSFGTATTQKISFYGVTPVVQPTALTTALTSITSAGPGTPDYAIAALTSTTPFGFVSADEGETVLTVITNLQARVNELETKLQALGLLA
jgi:hypothetical protein